MEINPKTAVQSRAGRELNRIRETRTQILLRRNFKPERDRPTPIGFLVDEVLGELIEGPSSAYSLVSIKVEAVSELAIGYNSNLRREPSFDHFGITGC